MPKLDINRLQAQRKGQRGVVIRQIDEANCLVSTFASLKHEDIEEHNDQLQTILTNLQDKQVILHDYNQEIMKLANVEQIEEEINEADDMNNTITNSIKAINRHFKQQGQAQSSNQQIDSSRRNSNACSSTHGQDNYSSQVNARLPKINLPKFSGDHKKFTQFWDRFNSLVHINDKLSNVDKFNYLNGALEPNSRAARAVEGFTITDANYHSACELLKEQFGNTQRIISAHMDDLLKLPTVTKTDRASQLRYLYDKICVSVRGLEALDITSDRYGCFLIPVIMTKLPDDVRIQVARLTAKDVWEFSELLTAIKAEVQAREISESVKATEVKTQNNTNVSSLNYKKPLSTASSLFVRDKQSHRHFNIQCVYCKLNHYSSSCHNVKDVAIRKQILKQANRCMLCLRQGHQVTDCESSKLCRLCNGRHQQSVCDYQHDVNQKLHTDNNNYSLTHPNQKQPTTNNTTTTATRTQGNVLLQTARTFAYDEATHTDRPVRILFDTGSQRTYTTPKTTTNLGIRPIKTETLNLNTFGSENFNKKQCDLYNLKLRTRNGEYVEIRALSFPSICSPLPIKINLQQYPHLLELDLADHYQDFEDNTIDILVGADHYWDFISTEQVRGESGPVAINSKFGWLISGPVKGGVNKTNSTVANLAIDFQPINIIQEDANAQLIENLRNFWDIESIGITNKMENTPDGIFDFMNIQFNNQNNRYQVSLPWKELAWPNTNNYDACVSRLQHLKYKLNKDEELFQQYDVIIQEQVKNGIVEIVPDSELDEVETLYLPHHCVKREDKTTTKVRIVLDGSAKNHKDHLSINDCLDKGPNLTPHIFDMLVTFRSQSIGITADIEKAFHQIIINPTDRDMLRFLWFKNIQDNNYEIVQYRFCRLVFGLTSSPAILSGTIQYHLDKYKDTEPIIAPLLSKSLYVDDLSTGCENVQMGLNIYLKSKQIFSDGGFNIRKWSTNSPELREMISQTDQQNIQESKVKILGISWDTNSDKFQFDVTDIIEFIKSLPSTKRSVLKVSAKIFDPLGLLSPFTIQLKVLFQKLCEEKMNWDDNLNANNLKIWNQLINDFKSISNIQVSRCYFSASKQPQSYQLHGFSDASITAYSSVVYLRVTFEDGETEVKLVASKTRVSPLKKQTIPRLELLGATILARLMDTIISTFKFPDLQTFYWTDSYTTLCWIKNKRHWKQYVQNRVTEIRELSNMDTWNFCPGSENPADKPSRGCNGQTLVTDEIWWTGPTFLYKEHNQNGQVYQLHFLPILPWKKS